MAYYTLEQTASDPVVRGDDTRFTFTRRGTADPAGWAVQLVLETAAGVAVYTVSATLDATAFTGTLAAAQTAALTAGRYRVRLRRTTTGSVETLALASVRVID